MAIQHIVHPTDFSDVALNALRFAADLARHAQAQLHLVHVYERPYATAESAAGGLAIQLDAHTNEKIKLAIANKIDQLTHEPFLKGIHLSKLLLTDIAVSDFAHKLDRSKADLIVMGTHGWRGILQDAFVGTVSERVIRHAPMPVLTVPDGVNSVGIKRIVIATDFADPLDAHMPMLLSLAQQFDAEIIVGVINTRTNFATTRDADQHYKTLSHNYPYPKMSFVVYNDEEVDDGIIHLSMAYKADMLCMLTHGRTGITRLMGGSIAEYVSKHLKTIPLLSFKNTKQRG